MDFKQLQKAIFNRIFANVVASSEVELPEEPSPRFEPKSPKEVKVEPTDQNCNVKGEKDEEAGPKDVKEATEGKAKKSFLIPGSDQTSRPSRRGGPKLLRSLLEKSVKMAPPKRKRSSDEESFEKPKLWKASRKASKRENIYEKRVKSYAVPPSKDQAMENGKVLRRGRSKHMSAMDYQIEEAKQLTFEEMSKEQFLKCLNVRKPET